MKKIVSAIISCAIALISSAQSTQVRKVDFFTRIKASTSVNVILVQVPVTSLGNEPGDNVKLEGDVAEVNTIRTEVKDGVLEIYSIEAKDDNDVKVYVNVTSLSSIEVSGAASVRTSDQITADMLSLNASGAGSIKMKVTAKELIVTVTGAANLNLNGKADKLTAEISGASELKAYNLIAETVNVSASGAANAKVNAVKSIEAKASGAATIKYSGDPINKNIEISGAGSVKKTDGSFSNTMMYDTNADEDSVRKQQSKRKYSSEFKYWNGLQFGVNGLMTSERSVSIPAPYDYLSLNYGKSIGIAANILEHKFRLYKNHLSIVTGLGFEGVYNNFKQPIRLDPNSAGVAYTYDSVSTYKKNKLIQSYINIPLMLVFNSNNTDFDHSFHLGVGLIGGYKLTSRTKQVFTHDGNRYKMTRKDDYNINPFRLCATARVGYGGVSLFTDYSLTPLFEKKIGPSLYPFTIGVTLNL